MLIKKPYIVAEIGVNHNGSLGIALDSIKAAAKSGADAVKFQSFDADEFMSQGKEFYTYKTSRGKKTENMYKMFKRLELSNEWYKKIIKISKKYRVDFFCTAGDEASANFINNNKLKFIKISSPDLTNYPLLKHVAKLRRKTIISTGMADQQEIDKAVKIFKIEKTPIILMHCVSIYPTPEQEAHLLRITSLRERYKNIEIGYSDHTLGADSAMISLSLGASIFEKHFTLNKKLVGPDHIISSDPKEFKEYVKKIRKAKLMLGEKKIQPSVKEIKNRNLFRRSITVKDNIIKGEKFSKLNIALKRPEKGLHPKYLNKVIGKKSKKNLKKDYKIKFKDIT
tara:strand:+ start:2942 stop:3958 length:1017 start_codon:yes stop_codon:yes gene_type:complete